MKDVLDEGGDFYNLHKLVFHDLDPEMLPGQKRAITASRISGSDRGLIRGSTSRPAGVLRSPKGLLRGFGKCGPEEHTCA